MKFISHHHKFIAMYNRIYFSFFCMFFCSVFGKVNAQYDDVYFDPSDRNKTEIDDKKMTNENDENYNYSSSNYNGSSSITDNPINPPDNQYDDASLDDEDYDYYYSSRIKRFHQRYYSGDFYDPFYSDILYYDPYYFDPFLQRDIYAYSNPYRDYVRYRRWNSWYVYSGWNYWNSWNWWYGYNPYGPVWSYNFYYNPWNYNYYGGWNYPRYGYGWGGRCGWYDHRHYSNWNNGYSDSNNPKGRIYGSRRNGITQTSKYGPIRFEDPSNRNGKNKQDKAITPDLPNREKPSSRPERDSRNRKEETSPVKPENNRRGRFMEPGNNDNSTNPGKRPDRDNKFNNQAEPASSPKKESNPNVPRRNSGTEENSRSMPKESTPPIIRKHGESNESSQNRESNLNGNFRHGDRVENDQYYSPTDTRRSERINEKNTSVAKEFKERSFRSNENYQIENSIKPNRNRVEPSAKVDRSLSAGFERKSHSERSESPRIESQGSRFSSPRSSGSGFSGPASSGHNASGHGFSGHRR